MPNYQGQIYVRGPLYHSADYNDALRYAMNAYYLLIATQPVDKTRYPHVCPVPTCAAPAFIMFSTVECSNTSCKNWSK